MENRDIFGNKKVSQGKFDVNSLSQEIFYQGYLYKNFEPTELFNEFTNILKNLFYEQNMKSGFAWKEKYEKTFDISPNTFTYDEIFTNFLFDQKIPELIKKCFGTDLYLGDMTYRKSLLAKGSYMGWHRDTYNFNNEKYVGRTPPLIKLIYYPNFDRPSTFQVQLCKGSHKRYFNSKYIDRLQTILTKPVKLFSNNKSFLLFDTFLYHGAAAQRDGAGGARLIYNFCTEDQLVQFPGREDLHQAYKDKLKQLR